MIYKNIIIIIKISIKLNWKIIKNKLISKIQHRVNK